MKSFLRTSYFQNSGQIPLPSQHKAHTAKLPAQDAKVSSKQLRDWQDRLRQAADEAQDNELYALESDLLDLRDEVHTLL